MGIELALQQPPALVAQAECGADWMKLPGIEEFAARLKCAVQEAREKSAVARVTSWEIIRQCYEYGNRPDVRARVGAMNHQPDGSFRRGRPFAGHRLAMEAIAVQCGVQLRTVERWQTSFNELCRSGLMSGQDLSDIMSDKPPRLADRLEEIEARIAAKEGAARKCLEHECDALASEGQLPPEAYGERLAHGFLRKARLEDAVNPAVVRGLLRALCPVLERHGYTVYSRTKRSSA